MTAAARLTEDPSVSVAVLEAGQANLNDPKITVPGQFTQTFTNPQVSMHCLDCVDLIDVTIRLL